MVTTSTQEKINRQLLKKLDMAYICVDHSMLVTDASNNIADYGFNLIPPGSPVDDYVDFMVGVDSHTELELPLVTSPSGIPISVSFLPDAQELTVLITNASVQAEQRQQLQQKANENELLFMQQKSLMAQLETASSELERKNQQLEEAARLQTSFLSGVSHEFRTPLTSIIGYTNLVKQNLQSVSDEAAAKISGSSDSAASYLQAVQRSSKHLLSLVENLLDHGKFDSEEVVIRPKPTNLCEVFNDVEILLRPLGTTKNISFAVSTDFPDGNYVQMDDSRLRQCLVNIVGNAVKFTDTGSVKLQASFKDEMLKFRVRDTGPGISDQDIEKILLPFWQGADTGKAGTGLGLTITERLVELMGGTLSIESELGVGTVVEVNLPAPELPEQGADADTSVNSQQMPLKILLAEDDPDIADLVWVMLAERGMDVTHVENGALAIDAVEKAAFDLVLMDIHMPIMTGYEAIAELKNRGDSTPIIVMSASAIDADRQQAEQLGCDAYLIKPIDIDDLMGIAATVTDN